MSNKSSMSSVFEVKPGFIAVASMINGTTESDFTLLRGADAAENSSLEDFEWVEVVDHTVKTKLNSTNNPVVVSMPGFYRFQNNGFDDEQADICVDTYDTREGTPYAVAK